MGLLDPMTMAAPAIWLASDLSEGVTGCRYIAKKWDSCLPPAEAAEKARDIPIFVPVKSKGGLEKVWDKIR